MTGIPYDIPYDRYLEQQREVINLHIGQAGCDFGTACWEINCLEHGVRPDGTFDKNLYLSHSFFNETQGGKAVPRAAFIDLESSAIDDIRVGEFRHLFKPSNMLNGKEDAASCFGRGFSTLGKDLIGPAKNCIRTMAEACGGLKGFLIFRSYGGGTGSGFTARLMEELSNDFPKLDKFDFSVFLSPKLCSLPVEPYNGAFALHHSLEYSCVSFIVDNEACYDICDRLLNACGVRYKNINRLLAHAVAYLTSPFRFDGNFGFDMNEMRTNLLPLPRLQYPIISCAPLISKDQVVTENITESSIINSCFHPANQLIKTDVKKGTYMTCTLLFRGEVNHFCVNTALQTIREKKSVRFVKWSPLQFKVGLNNTPFFTIPSGDIASVDKSCVMLSNCTHVKNVFEEMSRKFDILYSRKAFIHWFVDEGLEEGDFHDTRLDLSSLISEYSDVELEK